MRLFDEFARLWNDTRSRMPQIAWSRTHWIWPLAAAVAGALLVLIGARLPGWPVEADADSVVTTLAAPAGCEEQTWPFFSDDCLWRNGTVGAKVDHKANHVRVLSYEPAMATAAIGATQWAPKGKAPAS